VVWLEAAPIPTPALEDTAVRLRRPPLDGMGQLPHQKVAHSPSPRPSPARGEFEPDGRYVDLTAVPLEGEGEFAEYQPATISSTIACAAWTGSFAAAMGRPITR